MEVYFWNHEGTYHATTEEGDELLDTTYEPFAMEILHNLGQVNGRPVDITIVATEEAYEIVMGLILRNKVTDRKQDRKLYRDAGGSNRPIEIVTK